jgi:hypothetical protein
MHFLREIQALFHRALPQRRLGKTPPIEMRLAAECRHVRFVTPKPGEDGNGAGIISGRMSCSNYGAGPKT